MAKKKAKPTKPKPRTNAEEIPSGGWRAKKPVVINIAIENVVLPNVINSKIDMVALKNEVEKELLKIIKPALII